MVIYNRKITLFPRNHQENHKKSASYLQITTKSTVNYKLLTVNYKLLTVNYIITL